MEREHGDQAADFRTQPRKVRASGEERGAPEEPEGALPADADNPEFSRGEPLDDAQPSARRRPELESEQAREDDADVRKPEDSY